MSTKTTAKKALKKTLRGKSVKPALFEATKFSRLRYKKFQLPTFRSPLKEGEDIEFQDAIDHAFFLRCCELFRVLDLMERKLDDLIEIYSKYRNRQQFADILNFRYFDSEEELVAHFDPMLAANMFFLFNFLYEMRITLTYTDELPHTVKKDIEDSMLTLKEGWNKLVDGVESRYGWRFKKLEIPAELSATF